MRQERTSLKPPIQFVFSGTLIYVAGPMVSKLLFSNCNLTMGQFRTACTSRKSPGPLLC